MRTASDVPADGATLGEIALRGNNVMLGYYRDEIATRKRGTRRLVPHRRPRRHARRRLHRDQGPRQGHHHLRRRKHRLGRNRARAVVPTPPCWKPRWLRRPDAKWGEVPVAFVTLKPGCGRRPRTIDRATRATSGALQGAEADRVRRPAEKRHRQDPEVRAARARAELAKTEMQPPMNADKRR